MPKMEDASPRSSPQTQVAGRWYVAAAVISGIGILGKVSLLASLSHAPRGLITLLLLLWLSLCFFWKLLFRVRRVLGPVVLLLLFLTMVVIYPRMEAVLHKLGRGSDQAECVVVAADRMTKLEWPYDRSAMSSKNAMSCGPGWVAAQAPAIRLLGYKWNLALCWIVSVGLIALRLGWDRASGFALLVGLSPGTWLTALNGSDFLTFGVVLAAFFVVVETLDVRRSSLQLVLATIVLGLIAQFRVVTLLISAFFAKRLGRVATIAAWLIATGFQVGFLLWHGPSFVSDGPLHLALKLMRTSVISDQPVIAATELFLVSLIGLAVVWAFADRTRLSQPLLLFLLAAFFVPGCEDLVIKYLRYGNLQKVLEFWEGGIWIVGCLPLAAAGLVMSRLRQAQDTPAPEMAV